MADETANANTTSGAAEARVMTAKLDDVELPITPDKETTQEALDAPPEWRADVARGEWRAPPSKWKINDRICLRLANGGTAGHFTITACHRPQSRVEVWRYDVKDDKGNAKRNINVSKIV